MEVFWFDRETYVRMYNCSFYSVDSVPFEERQHVIIGIIFILLFVLFEKQEYDRLYNCTFFQPDSIPYSERQHVGIGISFVAIFVLFIITYVPTLTIMSEHKFLKHSCYKIMFVMGIFDVLCLFINALATGLFTMYGYVFCSSPNLIYILGAIGLGLWTAQSSCGIVLAFNRWLELSHHKLGLQLFQGNRTLIWIAVIALYGICVSMFTRPLIFNGVYCSWFFNPHIGNEESYNNYIHSVHNIFIIVGLVAFYFVFFAHIMKKTNAVRFRFRVAAQKQSLIQVAIICTVNVVAAIIYVYMQVTATNKIVVLIGQYAWVLAHGAPSVIYLSVNHSLQTHVKHLMNDRFRPLTANVDAVAVTNASSRSGREFSLFPVS